MSRIAQLKETSDFLGINITFNEEDKKHTFNQICSDFVIKIHDDYKNSIFYIKNDIIYMELNISTKYLWCSYNLIWRIFENEYDMQHTEIQNFIKRMVENTFEMKGLTPARMLLSAYVENTFEMKDLIPRDGKYSFSVENTSEMKDYHTSLRQQYHYGGVEKNLKIKN